MKTNRDASIERLLRRPVKTEAPASGACPDAEALAAFADDVLSAAERQSVEAHIADCDRCQAMTAAMVRTAEKGVGSPTPFWGRRRMLTWLVPATAAAAAVALWVAVPGQRSPETETQQAKVQLPPASPPQTETAAAAKAPQPPGERADSAAPEKTAEAITLGSTASADAKFAAPAEALSEPDQNRLARQERGTPEQERSASEEARSLADQAPPLASLRAAAPAAAVFDVVVSSDPLIRWRVGPGVVVQYSADGGATWAAQETGAAAPLTGGSAPSPSVCWLVGRSGTVLRSADGGRQWQRVRFPEAVDLIGVRASNALTATVDLADGRRFGTTDGGQTWVAVQK